MIKKNQKKIIIEFVGLPGTGKTTLSKKVVKSFESKNISSVDQPSNLIESYPKIVRIIIKLFYSSLYFMLHPLSTIEIFLTLIKSKQKKAGSSILVFINLLYIISLYNYNQSKKISIYDQGLFQAVWALLFQANRVEFDNWDKIIKKVIKKEMNIIVIFLNIDKEEFEKIPPRHNKVGRFEKLAYIKKDKNIIRKSINLMSSLNDKIIGYKNDPNLNFQYIYSERRQSGFSDVLKFLNEIDMHD